eukprot:scaffold2716_cov64-Phaeocystis_antarctica.AAC.6
MLARKLTLSAAYPRLAPRVATLSRMLQSVTSAEPSMRMPPPCSGDPKVTRGFKAGAKTHEDRSPPRDVQPDQLSPASGRDIHDPPRSLGVEHDAPGHPRLDGHVAVDAERRTAFVRAHVVGELVGARHQHDPAHRAIVERRNEVTRAERVPRAGL